MSLPNPRTCGMIKPDDLFKLINDPKLLRDVNIRELLTPIMFASFYCCKPVWEILKQYKNNEVAFQELCDTYGIDKDVLIRRSEFIEERYQLPRNYIENNLETDTSPYPRICHASTRATSTVENMTILLNLKYPRLSSNNFLNDKFLQLEDPRLDISWVYPPLSPREESFINQYINEQTTDWFLLNCKDTVTGTIKKLPWETGYLNKVINPQHVYIQFANTCKRHILLGPSGTLEGMLNVAEILGVDLRIMTLASMAWMYYARDHAMFDMMIVANTFFDEPIFKFKTSLSRTTRDENLKNDREQLKNLMEEILGHEAVANVDSSVEIPNEALLLNALCPRGPQGQQGGEKPCIKQNLDKLDQLLIDFRANPKIMEDDEVKQLLFTSFEPCFASPTDAKAPCKTTKDDKCLNFDEKYLLPSFVIPEITTDHTPLLVSKKEERVQNGTNVLYENLFTDTLTLRQFNENNQFPTPFMHRLADPWYDWYDDPANDLDQSSVDSMFPPESFKFDRSIFNDKLTVAKSIPIPSDNSRVYGKVSATPMYENWTLHLNLPKGGKARKVK